MESFFALNFGGRDGSATLSFDNDRLSGKIQERDSPCPRVNSNLHLIGRERRFAAGLGHAEPDGLALHWLGYEALALQERPVL